MLVPTPGGRLIISLDPLMNLLLHTMNVYDLLGQHGRGYSLKNEEAVRRMVDAEIYAAIAGKEQYFNPVRTRVNIYHPTMKAVMAGELYTRHPDEALLRQMSPAPFNAALVKMWDGFFKAYWDRRFEALVNEFRQMSVNVEWAHTLAKMERLSGRRWTGTMYVFAVEGTGNSAMTWGRNVSIGRVAPDGDAGFVHEGLHLLLNGEEWSQSPRFKEFMASRPFEDKFWGKRWASKYEQALVAALDVHIRGLGPRRNQSAEEYARVYFRGCGVEDLFDVAWPLVTEHVKNPGNLEDLMWALVSRAEARRAQP